VGFATAHAEDFRAIVRRKSEITVGNRDKLRGFPRQLLHCCNTWAANEDESCRECGDRLYFVLAKLKMIF